MWATEVIFVLKQTYGHLCDLNACTDVFRPHWCWPCSQNRHSWSQTSKYCYWCAEVERCHGGSHLWWLTLLMACTCRAHSCHTSAYEAESGRLWVWSQPGLQSQFYARLVYMVQLCTKTKGWRWCSVVEWLYSIEKAPSSSLSTGKWKQKRGRTKENYSNIMAKIWN